jgi:hypothetical protein
MGAERDFSMALGLSIALGLAFLSPCAEAANSPPGFTSTPPKVASVGALYEYDANATDPDNDPLYYYLPSVKPDNMTIDPASGYVSWTPANVGLETVIIWVTDGNFQVEQCFTVNVTPGNQPPQITSAAPTQAYVGQPYTYQVKAQDPEGDRIYYGLDNSPAGMTIVERSGLINWTPPEALADQTVSVVVKAMDNGTHTSTQYYALKVSRPPSNENHPPVVVGTDMTNATQGELYFYDITAGDIDGDALTFCITVGPPGMSIEPADSRSAVITWTPTGADVRVWEVRVTVSDGKETIMHNFSLNVRSSHPMHFNEDPAKPTAPPDAFCLVPPVLSVIIMSMILVVRSRRS